MKDQVKLFKALSDSSRLRILKMLEVRALCVCEITAVLGLAPSTVSKHLSILKDTGFILEEKEGKWVIHYLNTDSVEGSIRKMLAYIQESNSDDPIFQKDRNKALKCNREKLCSSQDLI